MNLVDARSSRAALIRQPITQRLPEPAAATIDSGAIILKHLSMRSHDVAMPQVPTNPGSPLPPRAGTPVLEQLKPQLLQAVVVSSALLARSAASRLPIPVPAVASTQLISPLTEPGGASTPPPATSSRMAAPLFQVQVQWQGRLLEVISPQPFPAGTRLQLEISADRTLRLLSMQLSSQSQPATRPRAATQAMGTSATNGPALPLNTATSRHTTVALQQALRATLPPQQPLHRIMPALIALLAADGPSALPTAVRQGLRHLLEHLPSPQQLQHPRAVREAIVNSGAFTEARLLDHVQQQLSAHGRRQSPAEAEPRGAAAPVTAKPVSTDTVQTILNNDRKAQIGRLLGLLQPLLPSGAASQVSVQSGSQLAFQLASEVPKADIGALGQQSEPMSPAGMNTTSDGEGNAVSQELGLLQRLLQAAVARLQLHQLDGLVSRQPPTGAEQTAQPPAWLVELPLQTPHGTDQLKMRFEQRREQGGDQPRQWQVQLDFDLHDLGRFSATVHLNGQRVNATLWSEREHTHDLVRGALAELREQLGVAGVEVGKMHCRLGLPAPTSPHHRAPLVDLHT